MQNIEGDEEERRGFWRGGKRAWLQKETQRRSCHQIPLPRPPLILTFNMMVLWRHSVSGERQIPLTYRLNSSNRLQRLSSLIEIKVMSSISTHAQYSKCPTKVTLFCELFLQLIEIPPPFCFNSHTLDWSTDVACKLTTSKQRIKRKLSFVINTTGNKSSFVIQGILISTAL